jgi:cell division septation protein DedD
MPPMPTEDSQRADPLAEHRQRARWRFIGALIFAMLAAGVSYSVLLDTPRPLAREFAVLMPGIPGGASPAVPQEPPVAPPAPSPDPAPAPEPATPPAPAPAPAPAAAEEPTPAAKQIFVQVGAYSTRTAAEAVKRRLEAAGHPVSISAVGSGAAQRHRVRIGPLQEEDANGVLARAKLQGYEATVVRVSP